MSKVYLHNTILNDIANAIREKSIDNGHTYSPSEFASYISSISKKPSNEPLVTTVTSQLVTVEDSTLTAIGNAIRKKLNTNLLYRPKDMPALIRSIPFSLVPEWSWSASATSAEWWAGLKEWLKTAPESQIAAKVGVQVYTPDGDFRCVHAANRHLTFERVYLYNSLVEWPNVKDSTVITTAKEIWEDSTISTLCEAFYQSFVGRDSITETEVNFFLHGRNEKVPVRVFIPSYLEYTGIHTKWMINSSNYVEEEGEQFEYYKNHTNFDRSVEELKHDGVPDGIIKYHDYLVRSISGREYQLTEPVSGGSHLYRPATYKTINEYIYRFGESSLSVENAWARGLMSMNAGFFNPTYCAPTFII